MKKILILIMVALGVLLMCPSCAPKLTEDEQQLFDMWDKYVVSREETPAAILVSWNKNTENSLSSITSSVAKVNPRYDKEEDIVKIIEALSNDDIKAQSFDSELFGEKYFYSKKDLSIAFLDSDGNAIMSIFVDDEVENCVFLKYGIGYPSSQPHEKQDVCIYFENDYINVEEFINNLPEE